MNTRTSSVESPDPDRSMMQRAYSAWAPVYDLVCSGLFANSRKRVVDLASASGREVLEIGVGTGLSLADYRPGIAVSGIDSSEAMISKARLRAGEARADIRCLETMDAEQLGFADAAFDSVVAQFLITLVPNPERVLDEAYRVLRPGGSLFLLNHFRSRNRLIAGFERQIAPMLHHVGLRPDFPFARIEDWVATKSDITSVTRMPSGPMGCFSIVRIIKAAA